MKPSYTILLVEDNAADIKITQRALRDSPYPVELEVVRDGHEAIEYLTSQGTPETPARPFPDLVLLDINLPRMTGHQVLQRIRATPRLRTLPVVVLTTSRRQEDIQEMYASGANTYVEKPQEYNRFVEVLGVLLRYWLGTAILPPAPA